MGRRRTEETHNKVTFDAGGGNAGGSQPGGLEEPAEVGGGRVPGHASVFVPSAAEPRPS